MEPIAVFADRYRLDVVLGVGGMGCVYRAWDDKLDRMVAVKVLRSELIADASQPSKYLDRFRREAKVIAGFDHPGIVQVYDMGEGRLSGQTVYYLVMQLVSGMTLSAAHQKYGPLATLQLIEIMAKVLAALQHAHDRGVVHR
ncbi:protein kinase domain-containing protein, partial [Smaragdicoccus niigatensis]